MQSGQGLQCLLSKHQSTLLWEIMEVPSYIWPWHRIFYTIFPMFMTGQKRGKSHPKWAFWYMYTNCLLELITPNSRFTANLDKAVYRDPTFRYYFVLILLFFVFPLKRQPHWKITDISNSLCWLSWLNFLGLDSTVVGALASSCAARVRSLV